MNRLLVAALAAGVAGCSGGGDAVGVYAWVTGALGMGRSESGGAKWHYLDASPAALAAVRFNSTNLGYAAGSTLWQTRDGGNTFRDISANIDIASALRLRFTAISMSFGDDQDIAAVGNFRAGPLDPTGQALVIASSDGGEHFANGTIDLHGGVTDPALGSNLDGVCGGLAIGQNGRAQMVLRSDDTGLNWTNIAAEVPAGSYSGIACWIADVWLVGSGPARIVHSADGGLTWHDQTANAPAAAYELAVVEFVNATEGWAVGSVPPAGNPAILHTTDGGAHWSEQRSPVGGRLQRAAFAFGGYGVAIGDDEGAANSGAAIAIYTTNGGNDWSSAPVTSSIGTLSSVAVNAIMPPAAN